MKPLLADNWIPEKLAFPLIGQPKIDGVRALNMYGRFTGRSLKGFANRYVTSRYSHSSLIGFDGEVAAGPETAPDLCRTTSSALGTILGEPYILWWLFDYVTVANCHRPYVERLQECEERFYELRCDAPDLWHHLRRIPWKMIGSLEELEVYDAENLEAGFEGTILRDPNAPHKQGRSGKKPILWRIKRFVDFEFRVHTLLEGDENQNEATINELGHTERSSHQENMVPNGMIGAMLGHVIGVVKGSDGAVLFEDGQEVKVSAGCLTHAQRKYYFDNQSEFKNLVHKGKFFPKGIKDKLRFPTWQSFRMLEDLS